MKPDETLKFGMTKIIFCSASYLQSNQLFSMHHTETRIVGAHELPEEANKNRIQTTFEQNACVQAPKQQIIGVTCRRLLQVAEANEKREEVQKARCPQTQYSWKK